MPICTCRYELGAALPFHPEQTGPLSFLTPQKQVTTGLWRSCLSEASIPPTPLTRTSQAWCCPWLPAAWQKRQRLTQCSPYSTLPPGCSKVDSHFPLPQDFQEHYVQTGPGQLFVGSTQRFLHDGLPASLRCNHSIQYDEARGPQPQLVQHLRASSISSAFDPEAEALRFRLTTALQAGEAPVSYLHCTS